MDLTTRVLNNTGRDLTVEVMDQFNLRRGPRRQIKPGGSLDLGRRIGFSDDNPLLQLHLRVSAQTKSGFRIATTIMPIDVFVSAEIYVSAPGTNGEMVRVNCQPAARSINTLGLIRGAKDLKAYVVRVVCGSNPSSIV